jgi:hypothetical protein
VHKIYPMEWLRLDPSDQRNQFHLTALHEARIATDYRQAFAPIPARDPGFVARIRLAIAGGPAATITEPCSCPA